MTSRQGSIRKALVLFSALVVAAAGLISSADTETNTLVRVRQKFFGVGNVDAQTGAVRADRVIFSWVNNSSFAGSINGHVVLFDAFFPTHNPGYIPTDPYELGDLKPEFLFIGHGHFDHAEDVPHVLKRSGVTTLVGTPQHCDQMRDAMPGVTLDCVDAVARDAQMGDTRELDLIPGVEITALKHPHSAAGPPDLSDPNGPFVPTVPVPPAYEPRLSNPPLPQEEPEDDGTLTPSGDEGGSVLYQVRVGEFALTFHDTTGPVEEGDATWNAMRALPPTDVQFGAVVNFGQLVNGMRDVRTLVRALRPKIFVPNHHDDWHLALGSRGDRYEGPVTQELNKMPEDERPTIQWIVDPEDYLKPDLFTYDPTSSEWN
jgi:hypothetical protein